MKKLRFNILILILAVIPFVSNAQKKKVWNKPLYDNYPYHFGFAFGVGMLDFSVNHSMDFAKSDTIRSILGRPQPLFRAGVVGVLKLNNYFDLRFIPGLTWGQRNLEYIVHDTAATFHTHTMKIESTFVDIPFYVKYRAVRKNNYRPYIIGGVNYTIDLATRKKIKDKERPKIRLNRHDVLLEAGAGIDFYLPFFKFSTQLTFSYGFLNMVSYKYDDEDKECEQYANVFDRLGTKMVTLSIFFE